MKLFKNTFIYIGIITLIVIGLFMYLFYNFNMGFNTRQIIKNKFSNEFNLIVFGECDNLANTKIRKYCDILKEEKISIYNYEIIDYLKNSNGIYKVRVMFNYLNKDGEKNSKVDNFPLTFREGKWTIGE